MSTPIDGITSIVSDLAPLAQLVGEKTVKQFLGSVNEIFYYPLLAFAPIGVVTMIVTAIRVARFQPLMGLIGRSEETELELVNDVLQCITGDYGYAAVETGDLELSRSQENWCKALIPLLYIDPLIYKEDENGDSDERKYVKQIYAEAQFLTGIPTPGYIWAIVNAKEAGMLCRPSTIMIRRMWGVIVGTLLFFAQIGMIFIRLDAGDYWWSAVAGFVVCIGALMICWSVDSLTDDSETHKFSRGGWVFSHGMAAHTSPTTYISSIYAPHQANTKVRLTAIVGAFVLTTAYIINYLGLRQLYWAYSLGYVGIGLIGTVMRELIVGLTPNLKLKEIKAAQVFVTVATCDARGNSIKERFSNKIHIKIENDNNKLSGILSCSAASAICQRLQTRTVNIIADQPPIGTGFLFEFDGKRCIVVVTRRCSQNDIAIVQRIALANDCWHGKLSRGIINYIEKSYEVSSLVEQAIAGDKAAQAQLLRPDTHMYATVDLEDEIEQFYSATSVIISSSKAESLD